MTSNSDQKIALITGATSPIGGAIAKRLHSDNYKLVLAVNSSFEQGTELSKQFDAVTIAADLSEPDGPELLVTKALEQAGSIDALVNNAACQKLEEWSTIDSDKWDEMLDVNLKAAQLLMNAVSGHIISEQKKGAIVNISSIAVSYTHLTLPTILLV